MGTIIDADGNEVEIMSEDEVAALEAKAARADELEAVLRDKEEQLAKLSDKDFNFSKFRQAEEAKREEMMKGFSSKEKTLIGEVDNLRARQDENDERYYGQAKESALRQLAGDDAELRAKLDDAVKESVAFLGKPKDAEEISARYERAYGLLMGTPKTVNPLFRFSPVTGQTQVESGNKFTDTPDGKALFESKFAKEIAKAKARGANI